MTSMPNPESPQRRNISRRTVLKAGILGGAAALVGCGDEKETQRNPLPSHTPDESHPPSTEPPRAIENSYISLGGTETEINLKVPFSPDGHIPYVDFDNGERVSFLSGSNSTYRFSSRTSDGLFTNNGAPAKGEVIVSPDRNVAYKNGYSAITSVLKIDDINENHLFAITHNEQRKSPEESGTFTATIGLLESFDRGKSWKDNGVIIRGQDTAEPGERVTGAGQPCAIIRSEGGRKYAHIYYIDWASGDKVKASDQIYLARMLIDGRKLGEVEYLTQVGFKADIKPGEKMPVITPPSNIPDSVYAALPGISYNKQLNQLLGIIETNVGFAVTKSKDGILWDKPELIFRFPQPQSDRKKGDTWYSYPTLISPNESSDQITNSQGELYFSKGLWQTNSHKPAKIAFQLK